MNEREDIELILQAVYDDPKFQAEHEKAMAELEKGHWWQAQENDSE